MGRRDKENKQKRVVKRKKKDRDSSNSTNPAHGLIYRLQPGLAAEPPCLWGRHTDHHSVSPVTVDGAKARDDDCPCETDDPRVP